ncbi:hypothetical protein OAV88_00515 [bacterium]|nr:hypothetical protein [bacterium]
MWVTTSLSLYLSFFLSLSHSLTHTHTHTYQILLEMIDEKNASDTVIAFDFDLTLKGAVDPLTNTPRVRDGERTFEILRKLKEMNVTMVIVTARQASERAWESVRSRASDLGLLNFIGKGRNMTKKVRNDVKQFYDMVKKEMETIPSKKRKKYPSKELVLKHFAFEFQKMFPEGNGSKLLSQALGKTKTVNLKSLRDAVQNILPPSQMEPPRYHGVPEIELKHQELPPKYMFQKCTYHHWFALIFYIMFRDVLHAYTHTHTHTNVGRSATGKKVWPCWEFTSTNGKSVVAGEGMIMTEHDKAECLHAYLDAYRLRPKHIIFVDDFVGNAYNFAWYFSDNKNNVSKQVPWPEKHHFGDRTNGVTPTIRPLSPQLKRVTSIWWNPKHEIESQAKQVDVDVSMLRTRSSECLKQFQIALQAKNFENAARLRKMGLVPLLRVWKSCNDDDTKDKHEMISALKASIGSDEKDEDEDEDGGNKKDWKAFIESKIDIVRKDIQSYVERRNWNEANKRQRVMLMPLERTFCCLSLFFLLFVCNSTHFAKHVCI